MFYRVTARLKTETAAELFEQLCDGSIREQKPDGREIVDAMNRAVLADSGQVEFSIVCHCSTPLAHERATVFDKHFDGLNTEVIENYQEHEGQRFMQHLAQLSGSLNHGSE